MKKILCDTPYLILGFSTIAVFSIFVLLVLWFSRNDPNFKFVIILFGSLLIVFYIACFYALLKKGFNYVLLGSTGVIIKKNGKKNEYQYEYFRFVQKGYYTYGGLVGVKKQATYIVISHKSVSNHVLTQINTAILPNAIVIRATRKNLRAVYSLLPEALQQKMKQVFAESRIGYQIEDNNNKEV